jgi:hypothetical protein
MHYVHVRQRLHAFAGRLDRSAAAGDESTRPERITASRDALAGLRAMNSLGAGRR